MVIRTKFRPIGWKLFFRMRCHRSTYLATDPSRVISVLQCVLIVWNMRTLLLLRSRQCAIKCMKQISWFISSLSVFHKALQTTHAVLLKVRESNFMKVETYMSEFPSKLATTPRNELFGSLRCHRKPRSAVWCHVSHKAQDKR